MLKAAWGKLQGCFFLGIVKEVCGADSSKDDL
jgi:hypothetical protein